MGAAVAASIVFGLAACDDPDDPFDGRDDDIDVNDIDDNTTPRIIVGTHDVRSRVRDAPPNLGDMSDNYRRSRVPAELTSRPALG